MVVFALGLSRIDGGMLATSADCRVTLLLNHPSAGGTAEGAPPKNNVLLPGSGGALPEPRRAGGGAEFGLALVGTSQWALLGVSIALESQHSSACRVANADSFSAIAICPSILASSSRSRSRYSTALPRASGAEPLRLVSDIATPPRSCRSHEPDKRL